VVLLSTSRSDASVPPANIRRPVPEHELGDHQQILVDHVGGHWGADQHAAAHDDEVAG
jgi:hypothetical protein